MLYHFIKTEKNNILFFEDGTILRGNKEKLEEEIKNRKDLFLTPLRPEVDDNKRLHKLILLMTEDCNMRCKYCYLDYGNFDQSHEKQTFFTQNGLDIIQQLYEKFECGIEHIIFFGGEPLIAFSQIEIIIDYVTDYCKKNMQNLPKFVLITNGILLDKLIWKKLSQHHVTVKVSMDGEEWIHDAVRKDVAGNGTWNRVKNTIESRMRENNEGLFFEMTLNRLHRKLLNEGELEKCIQGFKQIGFSMGSIACTEFSKDPSLDFQEEDSEWLKELIGRITDYCFKEMEKNDSLFIIDIYQATILLLQKKYTDYHCYTGEKQYTVTTVGEILPCTAYAHSNVRISLQDKQFSLQDRELKEQKCQSCWIRYYCRSFCFCRSKQRIEQNINFDVRCVYVQAIYESVIRNIVEMQQNRKLDVLINKLKEYAEKL